MPPTIVDLTASSPARNQEPDVWPSLRKAISVFNEARLRSVLIDLCKLPAVQRDAATLLLAPAAACRVLCNPDAGSSDEERDAEDAEASPQEAAAVAGVKRMRPRFVTCEQCEEEFDQTVNYEGDCVWHDGELDEIVEDFWCDHDERCHGEIDTPEMREEFPDGFIWSCCDQEGSAEGCNTSSHKGPGESPKRRRF